MRIAVDLDNTIDANPKEFQSMLSAFRAAGFTVVVLTGTSAADDLETIWQEKATYLSSLGCSACWDQMIVVSSPDGSPADLKAEWCTANEVDVLIDNSKDNAKAATSAGVPLVLVPWASRS